MQRPRISFKNSLTWIRRKHDRHHICSSHLRTKSTRIPISWHETRPHLGEDPSSLWQYFPWPRHESHTRSGNRSEQHLNWNQESTVEKRDWPIDPRKLLSVYSASSYITNSSKSYSIHHPVQSQLFSILSLLSRRLITTSFASYSTGPAFPGQNPHYQHRRSYTTESIYDVFEKGRFVRDAQKSFQFAFAGSGKSKTGIQARQPVLASSSLAPEKKSGGFPSSIIESITSAAASITASASDEKCYSAFQAGEDAFFVRSDGMGVADGVGGWAGHKDANPALYSLKLMHYAHSALDFYDDEFNSDLMAIQDYYECSAQMILESSYARLSADIVKERLVGSTTALIAILREDELRVSNIGDCGIMIIREGEAVFRNEEQQHAFNFPYQLGTNSRDSPQDAQNYTIKVCEGDIVILGTDGLFDNVFDEDIVKIVLQCIRDTPPLNWNPKFISDSLLEHARDIAEDNRYANSPFQTRAIQEGFYYQGGKLDDISVVVGVVRLAEDSPDRR